MSKSHVGYRIPPAQVDDLSTTPLTKLSEYTGIRSSHMANRSGRSMGYKKILWAAIISIIVLTVSSICITYIMIQSEKNITPIHVKSISKAESSTDEISPDYVLLKEGNDGKKWTENEIDQPIYETKRDYISAHWTEPKVFGTRNRRKRDIYRANGLTNHGNYGGLRLQRVGTGIKVPRDTEFVSFENRDLNEAYMTSLQARNNDKRHTDKINSCQNNIERCKSVLDSMRTLIKSTGDNVGNLEKLMTNIQTTDPSNPEVLKCMECQKIINDDSVMFVDDSHENRTPITVDNPSDDRFRNMKTPVDSLFDHGLSKNNKAGEIQHSMKGFSVDSSEYLDPSTKKTVEVSKLQNSTDDFEVTYIIKNTTIIKPKPRVQPQQELPKMKNTQNIIQIQNSTGRNYNPYPPPAIPQQPMMQIYSNFDTPTGPSALYNPPQQSYPSGWVETTGTETAVDEMPSAIPMNSMNAESLPSCGAESVAMRNPYDPRIMSKPQNEAFTRVQDDNPIIHPTAETTKTSQQVQYTPPGPWSPYSICFYGSPPSSEVSGGPPLKQFIPGFSDQTSLGNGAGYPFPPNQYPQRGYGYPGQPADPGYGPTQYNQPQAGPGSQFPYGSGPPVYQQSPYVGPTAPGYQGYSPNFGNGPSGPGPLARPYYCITPAPTFQFPPMPGFSDFQRNSDSSENLVGAAQPNLNEPRWQENGVHFPGYAGECGPNYRLCDDRSRCIPERLWCNRRVDCPDASDETSCSCRYRLRKDRICDGYLDCPRGEDELGCNGCPPMSFNCEYEIKKMGPGKCIPISQRCDGLQQCYNGKDELDCNVLTENPVERENAVMIGYTSGYLHKNWQGQWYPVCTASKSWATQACIGETGTQQSVVPFIRFESLPNTQPETSYLVQSDSGELKIVPTCYNKAVFVKCGELKCGTRVLSHGEENVPYDQGPQYGWGRAKNSTTDDKYTQDVVEKMEGGIKKLSEDVTNMFNRKNNATDEENVGVPRVVGGRASKPRAWPFLVAIHKNGYFHCGGAIVDAEWILTAAHCVNNYQSHYFEIKAGLLRRFSFSPMAQTRRANYIRLHPDFDSNTMINDLALIKLDEPLLFNRWIRPVCLPNSWQSGNSWTKEPFSASTCVTAGWGATVEHGPDPDHMREVQLPILRECKHPEDRNEAALCAGFPQGGRDACQGDSGGPLLCRYPESIDEWYIAGIVSHGEGCARPNEPGAYTKVSHFVNWINDNIRSREILVGTRPLTVCPGFRCFGGLGTCLPASKRCDGVVSCLDAEDEVNCESYAYPPVLKTEWPFANYSQPTSDDFFRNQMNSEYIPDEMPINNDDKSKNPETPPKPQAERPKPKTETRNDTQRNSENLDNSQQWMTTEKPGIPPQYRNENTSMPRFTCTRLTQSISMRKRCNNIIDCEDGTDEDNCTCRDRLANLYPNAICNGFVDCKDATDEENCDFCANDDFTCSRSGTCVPRSKMCDHKRDCPEDEDELDCFAFTNGKEVLMDLDNRPHLNLEGIVAGWKNGKWLPTCHYHNSSTQARLANEFCVYLGFGGVESFHDLTVKNSAMAVRTSTKNQIIPYEYPPNYDTNHGNEKTCRGLYVQCKPVSSALPKHLITSDPKTKNINYLWPWQVAIFVNGIYHCPGILLEDSWVLTSLRCTENLDSRGNYTTAMVGLAPTYLYVDGPHQQIELVNSIKISKKSDAAILHLRSPVNTTRYVQPIFVQKKIFPATRDDVCIATAVDERFRTTTTFLQSVPENCPPCHRCFRNDNTAECKNNTSSKWSGTIVCRGSGPWYPAAIFHETDLLCSGQSILTVSSMDYENAHLTELMDENISPMEEPACSGHRCVLGQCIPEKQVCDGVDDCRDGSDEETNHCNRKQELCKQFGGVGCECSKSELTCANGQCVPKEAFCDFKKDCDDGSDETPQCTCADYLRLTAPERLCNNVRDCLDKSDESNKMCLCKDASFKCSGGLNSTEVCVSHDFVCDGELDCPNGEDERFCRTVKGILKDPRGTGQVLRRSFGVWHSECFPSHIRSTKEISDLCRSMGFNHGTELMVRDAEAMYGPALVPERDQFYMMRMNRQAWITTRKNRPLVHLVVPQEPCYRAFVNCKI